MKRLVNYFTFKDKSILCFLNTKLNCKVLNRIMPCFTELGGLLFSMLLPTGHTTAAFITAIHLAIYLPQLAMIFLLVAMIVGISRIYLAVHYPSDVLIGAIIGIGTSIVSHSHLFNMFR